MARQFRTLAHGMRQAVFTPANLGFRGIAAVVFGITYSLGAVFSGIAFVVTAPAIPIFWILRRKTSNASYIDVTSDYSIIDAGRVAVLDPPTVPTDVLAEEPPLERTEDSTDDVPEVSPSTLIQPPSETSEQTDQTSGPASTSSIIDKSTGSGSSISSSVLGMIQNAMSAVRNTLSSLRRFTVTLSIEEGVIRVVVFRGNLVVGWDHVTLAPEIADAGDEPETPSDSARFQEVLTGLNVRRARLVTDLPLFTALERQFHLPQAGRSYVQPMVIAEVLDTIPFARDEVEISWHSQRVRDGHEIIAVAAPRSTIDSQVRFGREAGLSPRGTYSKASALALASGVPDAILIHNQPSETGVVLIRGGSPIVVHHLETPEPSSPPQDRADALAVAVEQVLGFYQTLVPSAGNADLPVVMTGLVEGNSSYEELLQRTLGREVLSCPPPVRAPDEFPTSEYAANLGLLLADKAGGNPIGKGPLRMGPTPNLLPERLLPQGLPAQAFLIFVVLILMGAAINPTTVQVEGLVQQADDLTAALVPLRGEVRDRRTDVGLESDAGKELESVNQQIAALEARVEDLDNDMTTLLRRLDSITRTSLPSGVRLASLAPGKGGFALNGNADSHNGILQYAANLRSSDLFSNATIEEITGSTRESAEGDLRFRILATVTVDKAAAEDNQNGTQPPP